MAIPPSFPFRGALCAREISSFRWSARIDNRCEELEIVQRRRHFAPLVPGDELDEDEGQSATTPPSIHQSKRPIRAPFFSSHARSYRCPAFIWWQQQLVLLFGQDPIPTRWQREVQPCCQQRPSWRRRRRRQKQLRRKPFRKSTTPWSYPGVACISASEWRLCH